MFQAGFCYNLGIQEERLMNQFIQFVLSRLQGGIALLLLAVPLVVGCILLAYWICKRKGIIFPWKTVILWILLSGYLLVMLYVTLLRGTSVAFRSWNLHLFRAWREAWNEFSASSWLNVLLNVAMFIPLGMLLPLLSTKLRKWHTTVGIGFALSAAIELLQLWRGNGVCDVDDLFANTLGALIGYAAVMLIVTIIKCGMNGKINIICYAASLLLSVGGICAIFIAYHLQPYGNIPYMASFRADTSNTDWSLACSLPQVENSAQTYRAKTMSKEACASLADEFTQTFGIVFYDIQYYDEDAFFMDHGGDDGAYFLTVNYWDGSYRYTASVREEKSWKDTDRETILSALSQYPLTIPENAIFSADGDGWHSFRADRLTIDPYMYDGTVLCRYGSDGEIYAIENHLIQYMPFGEQKIISPEEAYRRLCAGDFSDGEYFEMKKPANIQVKGAALEYRIDTKGFYRPVYVFALVSTDTNYRMSVMVRAN